jgi:predicted DNA-binding antitoxin AbrB/MazE fold protein
METIHAIFENGVFRPVVPVQLPERCAVHLKIVDVAGTDPMEQDDELDAIYEILDRRYSSGFTDTAARHNEHQP